MNYLFFSDIHIEKDELTECGLVLDEILDLCNQYKVDQVFNLGDTFDTFIPKNKISRPTSEEFDLFSNFIINLNRPMVILVADSHESENQDISILNHFSLLKETITTVKEYHDEDYLFLGHFGLKESKINNFGTTHSILDFKKYKYALLGHFHSFEQVGKNCIQLGSCRWINFNESQDKVKVVTLCENYKEKTEKWRIIPLKSPYPMIDLKVSTAKAGAKSEDKNWQDRLNSLPKNTKIRLIFNDFKSYSNSINDLEQYMQKFVKFVVKKDFLISNNTLITAKSKDINLKESLMTYLEKNKVNEEIKKILLGEIK